MLVRKQKAFGSLSKLNILGINSDQLSPFMKGQMFKIYIRPILYYGIENVFINKSKLNQIKRIDGNILKIMMMVPTRCRTTSLQLALNITPAHDHLIQIKLDFYMNLINNPFTKSVLEQTSTIKLEEDLKTEISKIVDAFDDETMSSQTGLPEKIEIAKYIIKANLDADKKGDEVKLVKEALGSKMRENIPKKLFGIIKF